jgi:tetratricopeptide (TPR) repeat protein
MAIEGITARKGQPNQGWALDHLAHLSGWKVDTIKYYLQGRGSLRKAKGDVRRLAEVVAREGIKVAWLNENWLRDWIKATAHPEPDKLRRQLFPERDQRSSVGVKHAFNRYSAGYIKRAQAYEILRAFQRSTYVILYGDAGIGKSVLANQVGRLWAEQQEGESVAVWGIWYSDRDEPGSTTRYDLLMKIAKYADHPGYGTYDEDDLHDEVIKLLGRGHWFLVIDHAHTITDHKVFALLEEITELGVRVLVTTSERRAEDDEIGKIIKARPMEFDEAEAFIAQELYRRELEVHNKFSRALVDAMGCHPRHLLNAIGYIAGSGDKTIEQAIEEVITEPERFTKNKWLQAILEEGLLVHERHLLYALSIFSTRVSFSAVCKTAGLEHEECQLAINRLSDRALIEVWRTTAQDVPRYGLSPLVRRHVRRYLRNDEHFSSAARQRQVAWCVELVSDCLKEFWENLYAFQRLDAEHVILDDVLQWCNDNAQWHDALLIAKILGYYYFLRGHWDELREVDQVRLLAAAAVSPEEEALAYAYYVQVLAKQRRLSEIDLPLGRVMLLQTMHLKNTDETYFHCIHATALVFIAKGKWQEAGMQYSSYLERAPTDRAPMAIGHYWLAKVLALQGRYDEALVVAREAYQYASDLLIQQTIVDSQVLLASIYLECKDYEQAYTNLEQSKESAKLKQMVSAQAEIQRVYGRYYAKREQWQDAKIAYIDAADQFKRLGLDHEVDAVAQEQAQLGL